MFIHGETPVEGLSLGSTYYAIVVTTTLLNDSKLEAESNISIDLTGFQRGVILYMPI